MSRIEWDSHPTEPGAELEFLRAENALLRRFADLGGKVLNHLRQEFYSEELKLEHRRNDVKAALEAYRPFRIPLDAVAGCCHPDELVRNSTNLKGAIAYRKQIREAYEAMRAQPDTEAAP